MAQFSPEVEVRMIHLELDRRAHVRRALEIAKKLLADESRLIIRKRPDAAKRLEKADEIQGLVIRVHHHPVERHPFGMPEIDEGFVKEGEGDPEAGAGANDVERLPPPVNAMADPDDR